MARSLSPDHRKIITALTDLGGKATTRQLADKVGRQVNGMSQSLGSLSRRGLVKQLAYKGGDTEWELIDQGGQRSLDLPLS